MPKFSLLATNIQELPNKFSDFQKEVLKLETLNSNELFVRNINILAPEGIFYELSILIYRGYQNRDRNTGLTKGMLGNYFSPRSRHF